MNIRKIILLVSLVIIVVVTGALGAFWIHEVYRDFTVQTADLEQGVRSARRSQMAWQVDEVIKYIEFMRQLQEEETRKLLRQRVLDATSLARSILREQEAGFDLEAMEDLLLTRLALIRFDNGRGYFFATRGSDGRELLAAGPELNGRELVRLPSTATETIVRGMVGILTENEEAFYTYEGPVRPGSEQTAPKLCFVQYFAPLDMYIGTAVFVEDLEREAQRNVLQRIYGLRYADDRFIYVFRYDGTTLYHRRTHYIGRNILRLKDADGNAIYETIRETCLNQGSGDFIFQWVHPDTDKVLPKIAYARAYPEWRWILATDMYMDDIETVLADRRADLKEHVNRNLRRILLLFVVAIVIVLGATHYLSRRLSREFRVFSTFFEQSARGYQAVDHEALRLEEFRALAHGANAMVRARREAELALHQEKERLAVTVRSIGDAVVTMDSSGSIDMFNRGAEELTGWSAAEARGRTFSEVVRLEAVEDVASGTHIQPAGCLGDLEATMICKNEQRRVINLSLSPIREQTGEVVGAVAVFRDVTEKRRFQERLEELVEQRTRDLARKAADLEEANVRLTELDRLKTAFLSSVSHELRTPLTSIMGFAKLIRKHFRRVFAPLAQGGDKTEQLAETISQNLEIICVESERLTRLINDVLDLSRIESGKARWLDAEHSVTSLISQASGAVEGRIVERPNLRLTVDLHALPAEADTVCVDRDRIVQVLLNLLDNACKHTQEGEITISARGGKPGWVEIEVADTGVGIPLHQQELIFDKFYQAHQGDTLTGSSGGTGLGLAISQNIVGHYGGRMWVESEPGRGSRFYFELPVASRPGPDRPYHP